MHSRFLQQSQGEGGRGRGVGQFFCKSQVSRKHPSDPMSLQDVPPREPGNHLLTSMGPRNSSPHG